MEEKKLSEFQRNDVVIIKGISCGREFSRRLCDLGLFEGTQVTILKNDRFGPIILQILNSKIALGRGEASKIYGQKI